MLRLLRIKVKAKVMTKAKAMAKAKVQALGAWLSGSKQHGLLPPSASGDDIGRTSVSVLLGENPTQTSCPVGCGTENEQGQTAVRPASEAKSDEDFDTGALHIHEPKRDSDEHIRVDGYLGSIRENVPRVGPVGPALAVRTKDSATSEVQCEMELPSVTDDQSREPSEESPTSSTPLSPLNNLSDRLIKKGQVSNWSGKNDSGDTWYPREAVQELFGEDTIRGVLDDLQHGRDDTLVEFIATRARMLFAIVVYSRIPEKEVFDYMDFFQQSGFNDSSLLTGSDHSKPDNENKLPVTMSSKNKTELQRTLDRSHLDDTAIRRVYPNSKLWVPGKATSLVSNQWTILVPVFSTTTTNYDFPSDTIMPFKKHEVKERDQSGAFGRVYKIEIYAGHFEDPGEQLPKYFALKEITPPNAEERRRIKNIWVNEVRRMKEMNERHNDHIVRCMTGFTQGGSREKRYLLILEWADGGSLEDLYKENENPQLNGELIEEAIRQLIGLIKALESTHNANIRHGDLKPANILRFSNTDDKIIGNLKIGDWGLAKLHSMATQDRRMNKLITTTNYGSSFYEPPEVEHQEAKILPRRYDIWSMGVVSLEMIIWLLQGYDGVKKFHKSVKKAQGSPNRETCYKRIRIGGDEEVLVEPKVVEWLDFLEKDGACGPNTALRALLGIIRDDLLVPDVPLEDRENGEQEKEMNDFGNGQVNSNSHRLKQPEHEGVRDSEAPFLMLTRATYKPIKEERKFRATATDFKRLLEQQFENDDFGADFWYPERLHQERTRQPPIPESLLNPTRGASNLNPTSKSTTSSSISSQGSTSRSTNSRDSAVEDLTTQGSKNISRSSGLQGPSSNNLAPQQQMINYKHPKLDTEWMIHEDIEFASRVINSTQNLRQSQILKPFEKTALCASCSKLDFFQVMGMSVEYTIAQLEDRAESCELCALFLKVARSHLDPVPDKVRFDKRDSYIDLNNTGIRAIQLLRDPCSTPWRDVTLGLPNVPSTSSEVHFEIIRQWLRLCDDEGLHPHCRAAKMKPGQMPTRLIDVGIDDNDTVRVWEPGKDDVSEYVALSHPWGDPPHFVSTTKNIDQHRMSINLEKLPATFRDAILTTRAIGKRYLWIDSICILQGLGGDFHVEAGRMEAVFSSAYCVLAASRARNQMDGFLGPRRERDYVAMNDRHRNGNFFLCENIDAFDRHVLGGHLHKRGWVLQEHALARRTIFFTEYQTYWECGDGVRCETLTKMTNNLAAFLGDPKFPRIIMDASQGEKIIRFQNLYKTYSSLLFTNPTDRPIAVSGIQRRLLEAFGTRGGYGVFDEDVKTGQLGLLRRSLLWHRAVDGEGRSRLSRIEFSTTERMDSAAPVVPSWSWMAYTGEISFLKLDFGAIDWIKIRSPWGAEDGQTTARFADGRRNLALKAPAWIINVTPDDARGVGKLYFDDFARTEGKEIPCVVLGTDRQQTAADEKVHYFILIEPVASSGLGSSKIYKRVGAGYLPGKYLGREMGWVDIY